MSTTQVVPARYTRFASAPWFLNDRTENAIIGGAGGIGSWLTILLTRMGVKCIVFDFDRLEDHNLGGQLYPRKDIGKLKVEALNDLCLNLTGTSIEYEETAFTEEEGYTHKWMFSAFDNMKARRDMFENWYGDEGQNSNAIFIDGRLNAEQMQIFCIRGGDEEAVRKYRSVYLFDDSEVEDAPCTFKQTSHAAAMIAAHMTAFFTNHLTNIKAGEDEREVPFMWEYFIPMNLITEKTSSDD